MNRRMQTIERIDRARYLLLQHPDGLTPTQLGVFLGITRTNGSKLMKDLGAVRIEGSRGYYTLYPDKSLIELANMIMVRQELEDSERQKKAVSTEVAKLMKKYPP